MKKLLALSIALTMGLSFCACGDNGSSSEASDAAEHAVSETAAETTSAYLQRSCGVSASTMHPAI